MRTISKYILKNKSTLSNSKGQAVLEYVLLTFMVMVVLLAIIIAIARSTERFGKNFYGAYFECLLETGELPTLGGDGNTETECDELYESFGADEELLTAGGSNSGDGMNGNDSSNDSNENSSDNGDGDSGKNNSASAGASEVAGPTGGSSASGADSFGRQKKVPLTAGDRGRSGSSSDSDDGFAGYNNFQQTDDFGDDGSGRSSTVPVYGNFNAGDDEEENKTPVVKAEAVIDQEKVLRGSRVPANSSKKDDTNVKPDEGVTFPDFIRILLIAVIILVIVIFFGGQVMQYQKSKD